MKHFPIVGIVTILVILFITIYMIPVVLEIEFNPIIQLIAFLFSSFLCICIIVLIYFYKKDKITIKNSISVSSRAMGEVKDNKVKSIEIIGYDVIKKL